MADTEAEGPSLSRRRWEGLRAAKPVRDYGGKSVLGVRFEDEEKAEMKGGGTYNFTH